MNESFIIGVLVVVIISLFISVINKLNSLEYQVKNLKMTLEQIASHMEIPEHPVNHTLRKLVKEGNGVQAVKKTRQVLGLSLLEAKEYVDKL